METNDFSLPPGICIVGDSPMRSHSQPEPQFRNYLEQREWRQKQAATQEQSLGLPEGIHVIDQSRPTGAVTEPMFLTASEYQPSMAQALKSGKFFLCSSEGDRDLAIAEYQKFKEVSPRAKEISGKWATLHNVGSGLPEGIRVV